MKRRSLLASSAFLIASTIVPNAFAESDELDVTMQVLDDVQDVDRVLSSIERELRAADKLAAASPRGTAAAADGGAPALRAPNRESFDLKSDIDRDEEGEGELEDYDVPEDVVLDVGC